MNCKEFENWLLSLDELTQKNIIPENAALHMSTCSSCKQLYLVDKGLETHIKNSLTQKTIPDSFYTRLDQALDQRSGPAFFTSKRISLLLTGICMIAALFYLNISYTPFSFKNLQQLNNEAVLRHLKGDTTMTFDAGQPDRAMAMLSKELEFKVIFPDLKKNGYILIGGRVCAVGKCKTAYLFYKNKDKLCSLFILDDDRLDFEMADGSRFVNVLKGCQTDIWKENGQVYAMVF